MKLHFYGTGASEGVPAIFCHCENCRRARALGGKDIRTRSSLGVDEELLIDFSSDVMAHMCRDSLDMTKIKYLFVTHSHSDHFCGEELLHIAPPYAWYQEKHVLSLYANGMVKKKLLAAGNKEDGEYLKFHLIEDGVWYEAGDYLIMPVPARHDPLEECHLFAVKRGDKTILYGHDSAFFSEEAWEMMSGLHFSAVILDCTCGYGPSVFEHHMGFEDNLRICERMKAASMADENTVFVSTHFAHTFAPFHGEMTEKMKTHGFIAAYDGLQLEV